MFDDIVWVTYCSINILKIFHLLNQKYLQIQWTSLAIIKKKLEVKN